MPSRHEIIKLEVAVPGRRLIPKLLSLWLQNTSGNAISTFLQGFTDIAEDYHYHITKELEAVQAEVDSNWMVLQIELTKSAGSRFRLSKKHKTKVIGVYVVIRNVSGPDKLFSRAASVSEGTFAKVPLREPEFQKLMLRRKPRESSHLAIWRLI